MHGCNTRFDIEIKKDGAISLWFFEGLKIRIKSLNFRIGESAGAEPATNQFNLEVPVRSFKLPKSPLPLGNREAFNIVWKNSNL